MPSITTQEKILAKLHQLPSLPLSVQEVLASFNNANLDTAVLAHKIEQDQGLSARVLRVANSTFYGFPRKISSIQEAVMVIGFSGVRSLVLSAGFMHAFPSAPGSSFDRQAYWKRSFHVAAYAKALAQCLRQDMEIAFTAGMFHDIGELVLDVCIPEQFAAMLERQKNSGVRLDEIERAELGCDHAEIGAEVARRWNFPPGIEHAVRYWRMPEHEPFDPVTGIVCVAALLESGLRGDELMARLPATLRDRLEISWERIGTCLPEPEQIDAGADLMLAA